MLVAAAGLVLGYDALVGLVIAMPPVSLVVVWIWRRLGVAMNGRPATF